MMRFQQFDLLLSAQKSDFESMLGTGKMGELDQFLRKIQFQSSRAELLYKGTLFGTKRSIVDLQSCFGPFLMAE